MTGGPEETGPGFFMDPTNFQTSRGPVAAEIAESGGFVETLLAVARRVGWQVTGQQAWGWHLDDLFFQRVEPAPPLAVALALHHPGTGRYGWGAWQGYTSRTGRSGTGVPEFAPWRLLSNVERRDRLRPTRMHLGATLREVLLGYGDTAGGGSMMEDVLVARLLPEVCSAEERAGLATLGALGAPREGRLMGAQAAGDAWLAAGVPDRTAMLLVRDHAATGGDLMAATGCLREQARVRHAEALRLLDVRPALS